MCKYAECFSSAQLKRGVKLCENTPYMQHSQERTNLLILCVFPIKYFLWHAEKEAALPLCEYKERIFLEKKR